MDLKTMRRLDRHLGVPLCAALTLWQRAKSLFVKPEARPIESVLFVKLAEQGSTVLAVSAFRKAIERVGRENVHFICFEENRFILDLMDLIPKENVITIKTGGLVGTMTNFLGGIRKARALKPSVSIDLEFFSRSSAILTYLSGADRRVGFHASNEEGPWRGDLMTHRLRFTPHLHTADLYRFMVDAMDLDGTKLPAIPFVPVRVEDEPPVFAPSASERERVLKVIEEAAGTREFRPLVLLNANCSDLIPLRAWPRERYVELAQRLLADDPKLRIAFTGAPNEAGPAQKLVEKIGSGRCFCLAGKTSLRDLLVVFGFADVLVTNDSGPAHFASLTHVQVVTLFGPETPALFASRSPRSHILWRELACSPCVSALNNRDSRCTDNLCMQSITVDEVERLVKSLLTSEPEPMSVEVKLPVITRQQARADFPAR